MITVEQLPYEIAPGAHNMAADEVMLECAARGRALLRFYGWTTATVSLGYFQSHKLREQDPLLAPLPFVRRPTGGATLVHHHELTYAFALSASVAGPSAQVWLNRAHQIIQSALNEMGVASSVPPTTHHSPLTTHHSLCFHQHAAVDLLIGANKILGSAQRRQRGALMQHGSILLAQSAHTPTLPGVRELAGKVIDPVSLADRVAETWIHKTGWRLARSEWTSDEHDRVSVLERTKYAHTAWNCKR